MTHSSYKLNKYPADRSWGKMYFQFKREHRSRILVVNEDILETLLNIPALKYRKVT